MQLPTITSQPTTHNPHMEDSHPGMFHFLCTLSYQGRTMTMFYSMGSGHGKRVERAWGERIIPPTPTARDVLGCVFMDAGATCETFAEWCGNFGYDTDSRKALATYLLCQEHGTALRKLLGKDYDAVAKEVEDV